MILVAAVFLASRCLVLLAFYLRGRAFPFMDAEGYIRQAAWLATHGSLLVPAVDGGRFFYGMPLIVSLFGRLTGEFAWTGVSVNAIAGMGACLLFYRNFARLDWALWFACLLPGWVTTSATFHSEAGQWLFCMVGLTALHVGRGTLLRRLLFALSGYAYLCRPTTVFILAPLLLFPFFEEGADWRTCLLDAAWAALFPVLITAWTLVETRCLFPQKAWQNDEFAYWTQLYGGSFPSTVFAWPGQSFLAGFTNSVVRLPIKVLNFGHFVAWAMALGLSARAWLQSRSDRIAALLTVELALNGLFILTIGGPFGHTLFYRFIATQANAFLLLALFRYLRLPSIYWWCASLASVSIALMASAKA